MCVFNESYVSHSVNVPCSLRNYVSAFIQHDKPLVAAVNGRAEGLGTTTLALCDLVFSSEMVCEMFPTPLFILY